MTQTLAGKRILVTGGAGFVGSHLVDALLDQGCGPVVVIDNMVRGRPANLQAAMHDPRLRIITGDICDT
ncbi:MAG: NAD-dependent epimerase/dehydratase family protein, partial [Paracoccus sp. (in: a-proteobacteria)]